MLTPTTPGPSSQLQSHQREQVYVEMSVYMYGTDSGPISVTIKFTLTCRMGSVCLTVLTIDIMINFDGDSDGHGHGDDTCRRALKYPVIINTQPVYVRVKI